MTEEAVIYHRETPWYRVDLFKADIFFIPLFFTMLLLTALLSQAGFEISSLKEWPASLATAHNFDIGHRVAVFYSVLFLAVIAFLFFKPLMHVVLKFLDGEDLVALNAISMSGCVLFFFNLCGAGMAQSIHLVLT